MGTFLGSDPKKFQGLWRNYQRIQVAIDVHRPLKSQMRLKKRGGEWMWIKFKYERLPLFCFYCGIIGHSEKFCEALFDNAESTEERKYDSSLRATMQKQVNVRNNQWLRGAEGEILAPVTDGGGGGKMILKGSSELPLTTLHDSRSVLRYFSPNDDKLVKNPSILGVDQGVQITGLDNAQNEGLIISKQKRARKDGEPNKESGLGHSSNQLVGLDTEMEEQFQQKQKNEALAGPVMQARLPQ